MPVAMQSRFVATLFYSLPYCLKAKSQPGARMATSKSQQFSFVCLGCLCVTCAQHMLALMEPVSSFSLSFVSALIFLLCVYVCECTCELPDMGPTLRTSGRARSTLNCCAISSPSSRLLMKRFFSPVHPMCKQ